MKDKIISKELLDELMLYDPESDEVHILNGTARRIYRLTGEGKSEAEIEAAIKEEFCPDEALPSLGEDIKRCLADLKSKGLI